jgi:hypothetical protein
LNWLLYGGLAQRESTALAAQGSGVQIPYPPPKQDEEPLNTAGVFGGSFIYAVVQWFDGFVIEISIK